MDSESKIELEGALEHLFNPMRPHLRAWTWLYNVEDRFLWPLSILDEQSPPLDATPLYYAVSCGFTWLAKRLIVTHAEDVNAKGYRNRTPLYAACKAGQVDVARMLPDHGAQINAKDDANWMPLHCLSWQGRLKVVQLLQHEGLLEAQTRDNDIPLCLASAAGKSRVCAAVA